MTQEKDELFEDLARLPQHDAIDDRRVREPARAAFVRAFEDTPWIERYLRAGARASVPVVLASVVGVYLFWAFAAAIAVVR